MIEFPVRKMTPNQLRAWITSFLGDTGITISALSMEAFRNPDRLRKFMGKSIRLEYKDDDRVIRAAKRLYLERAGRLERLPPAVQAKVESVLNKVDNIRRR